LKAQGTLLDWSPNPLTVRGEEWWNCCLWGEGVRFDAAFVKLLCPFVCVIIVEFMMDGKTVILSADFFRFGGFSYYF